VRVVTEIAYHNLFAHQLFLRPSAIELAAHETDFTVIALPGLQGDPEDDGLNSEAFIVLNLAKKIVLIGGTRYAGEIKKSVFSMMNYLMTKQGVLPMHGAANMINTVIQPSFSVSPVRGKPPFPPILNAASSVMMNTVGQKTAFLTLKAVVMLKPSV